MTNFAGLKRFGAVAALAAAFTVPAFAQDISDDHLKSARAAIESLKATDQFDQVIPLAAEKLKVQLIRANADLEEVISATVDEQALAIVPRRGDLEREAANIYAKVFTKEELDAINAFYTSPAGLKLIENGALVTRELLKAAEIWSSGITRDLAETTNKSLQEKIGQRPKVELKN